jgi:divalent metal cation (Fe/Co/Zn/Cd) transporter
VNGSHAAALAAEGRTERLAHALRLEYLTVAWNLVEGTVAVIAAHLAGSVALFGFGIDSFVEMASGFVLLWRLRAESRHMDLEAVTRLDRRARRRVGASLFGLAAWVGFEAVQSLVTGERPRPSMIGIGLTVVSMTLMLWLARAKRLSAAALHSHALETDAVQTTACFWLSVIVLCGVGLNTFFGWWWADPLAALGMTVFLVKEGREAWKGETHCC